MKIIRHIKNIALQLLVLILSTVSLHAQTTTGVWKGVLHVDSSKRDLPCEIVITEKSGFVRGYSYVSYNGQPPVLKKIKILFRKNNIAFEDLSPILEDTVFTELQKTNITYATALEGPGVMNGIWKTVKPKTEKTSSGSLSLQKVDDFRESEIFKQLDSLNLAKDLSFNKKREPFIENIDLAKLETDSVIKSPVVVTDSKSPDTIALVVKTPVIAIKEAVAVIKEKKVDTPVVAIVEKKLPPPPPPVVAVVKKPVEEKKLPKPVVEAKVPTVIAKTEPEKKTVVVAKAEPEKKTVVVAKKEPAPVVKKPVAPPPPPVVAVVKKPEPPPVVVVKKELPVQVFAAPDKDVAADISNRKTTTVQSVEYQSDSLILTLYDNGEVDGDTVSVLMNGKAIFSKAGLSTRPNRKTIYITQGMPDSLTLVMYAENLGSIPPNTGLLVVGDGDKVYELRFSADLKTNAAIIFRRKRQ